MASTKRTKEEQAAVEAEWQKAEEADAAAKRSIENRLGRASEYDPNSEASKQRAPLNEMGVPDGWWHDASHSADATRLAAQRARDEQYGMDKPRQGQVGSAAPAEEHKDDK